MKKEKSEKKLEIVRTWTCSTLLDAEDSRRRMKNPDWHPTISQARDGKFYNEQGKPLDKKHIPEYILLEAHKLPQDAPRPSQVRMTLAEAMQRSGSVTPGGQYV